MEGIVDRHLRFASYFSPFPTRSNILTMSKGKQAEKPFASLLAGATAGGIESFVTFPLESLKTQLQFGSLNGAKVRRPDRFPL